MTDLGGLLAHGIGGRVDLPVPRWLFVYGAATVVVISFVALAALWREPRLENRAHGGRLLPSWLQAVLTNRPLELILRGVSVLMYFLVLGAALFGEPLADLNLAPVFVFIWLWVGFPFLHAIFGNLWATISPFDTLGRWLQLDDEGRREYPKALGMWPAAILLFGFVWMELVYPDATYPPVLGIGILVYTAMTLAGMARFGRQTWNANGEFLAVYFGLISRIAPFARDDEGRVVARPPLAGLPGTEPKPGLVAFLMVLIGSTSFDGLSRTSFWFDVLGDSVGAGRVFVGTAGLLAMILLVAGIYSAAMWAAAATAGKKWHPLAVRFAHSLVPIGLAYTVAHYVSFLLLEGQLGLPLLSDPFGFGWNLFGTATWTPNFSLISATAVWYVQVAAIVSGHVGGVILAHDRAIAVFPKERALKTQYALLAVMVAFTAGARPDGPASPTLPGHGST